MPPKNFEEYQVKASWSQLRDVERLLLPSAPLKARARRDAEAGGREQVT